MSDTDKKSAIGYIRMSKDELENEPSLSIEAQEHAIRDYCASNALDLVELAIDVGVRASQELESRKGGRKVISLAHDGAVDAVVALSIDRLFHNATVAHKYVADWREKGSGLHLLRMAGKPVDSSGDTGQAMIDTLDGAAEIERHQLKENEVASAIQATLIPDNSLIELGGIDLAGVIRPATYCWGDWWNHYELAGGKTLIVIGDVTGHGVASAIVASAAQSAVTLLMHERKADFDLQDLFRAMNIAIRAAARGRLFMTCFACIYDPSTRIMSYANAGHNFTFVFNIDRKKLSTLVVRGQRLGDMLVAEDGSEHLQEEYTVKETEIAPNTTVVWYSDGIIECENWEGDEYGARRFRRIISKNAQLPADQLRDHMMNDATQYFRDVPPRDDISLVIGRIH